MSATKLTTAVALAVAIAGSAAFPRAAKADDLGGGAPGSTGLVPQLIADQWIPGRTLTLHLQNIAPNVSAGLCLIGTAPTAIPLPQNVGTLRVNLGAPHFFLPIGVQTPVFVIPPSLEGRTFYIQALVYDANHPAGGVLTDATAINLFTPMIVEGNTRQSSNNLKVVDVNSFTVTQTSPDFRGGKYNFTHDGTRMYVCEVETNVNKLARYDIVNGQLRFNRYINLSGGTRYHGAITRDDRTMYVPVHDGIAVVDLTTDAEVNKLPVSHTGSVSAIFTGPMDVALTPDDRFLYVAYSINLPSWPGQGEVGLFDLSQVNPQEQIIKITASGVILLGGTLTTHDCIDISGDGRWVVVGEFGFNPGAFSQGFANGGAINVIDTQSNTEIAAVSTGGYSQTDIAIDRMGRNVYSAHLTSTGVGEVVRVDIDHRHAASYAVTNRYTFTPNTFSVGSGPRGIDVLPDGSRIYATVIEGTAHPQPAMYEVDTWTHQTVNGPLQMASLPAHIEIQQRR